MIAVLLSLFWVGFGIQTLSPIWLTVGLVITLLLTLVLLFKCKQLVFSRSLLIFTLFNLVLFISTLWSTDQLSSLRLSLISLSGCLWWFIGSNLKKNPKFLTHLKRSIYLTSVFLVCLWAANTVLHKEFALFDYNSLVIYASGFKNHNNIGDFLIIPMLLLSFPLHLPLLIPLAIAVVLSQSRSALLGLFVGVSYHWFNHDVFKKYKKTAVLSFIVFSFVFFIMSTHKATIPVRDYFVQSIAGVIKYPWGVGFGNFEKISKDQTLHPFGMSDLALLAHSIVFEWLSGVGIISFIGVGWLAYMMYHFGFKSTGTRSMWLPIWWAMLIPLLVDTVYAIPTYWWLFMLITGMCEIS